MTLAQKDNNPLSLLQPFGKAGSWQGLKGQEPNGYLIFNELVDGVRAGFYNLILKLNNGTDTIEKIFSDYGDPGHEETYKAFVSKETGIGRNETITAGEQLYNIGKAIVKIESGIGFWVPENTFREGFNRALTSIKWVNLAKASLWGVIIVLFIGLSLLIYLQ